MTAKATTPAKKIATARKPAKAPRKTVANKTPKKPLRIRPELIPPSSTYSTLYDRDYVMIPVADFDAWYERFEDTSILDYLGDDALRGRARKPLLKTRKKHIPESTIKVSVSKTRYIAVPVADVQEWFEDIEDYAVLRYLDENPEFARRRSAPAWIKANKRPCPNPSPKPAPLSRTIPARFCG